MKTKITFFIALLISFVSVAQNSINYKALIKDNLGNVVANQSIDIQFRILKGIALTNVYQEDHTASTDANGAVIVNIGEGTTSDVFTDIDWASDDHFLNVQVNIGAGFEDMGTTKLQAVPYALSSADQVWEKSANHIFNQTESISIGKNTPPIGKVEVRYNSTVPSPHLTLYEDELDYARLSFRNSEGTNFWHVAGTVNPNGNFDRLNFYNSRAGDLMTMRGDGRVGIGVWDMSQKLEVNGKIKIGDDAAAPTEGAMRYNSNTKTFEGYDGTNWVVLNGNGSTNAMVLAPAYLDANFTEFTNLADGRVRFTIEFNIQMNQSSVVLGSSFLVFGAGGNATGTITWSNGGTRMTFTSNETYGSLVPDCFSGFQVVLKGDGAARVLDIQNKPIDGDKNGTMGGDFMVVFIRVC